tara:strand:- start:98 stop:328 length:231 start_codon:yes stop_codon:yes gene_type:complete
MTEITNTFNEIIKILKEDFRVDKKITYTMPVSNLELDSLDFINFIFKVEEINNVKIPNEFLDSKENLTLSDILEYK